MIDEGFTGQSYYIVVSQELYDQIEEEEGCGD